MKKNEKYVDPMAKELTENFLKKLNEKARQNDMNVDKDFRKLLWSIIKEERGEKDESR